MSLPPVWSEQIKLLSELYKKQEMRREGDGVTMTLQPRGGWLKYDSHKRVSCTFQLSQCRLWLLQQQ